MSDKTATERLRELLDERGVEHYDHENDEPLRDEAKLDLATSWRMGGASVCAVPDKNGTFDLWIDHATPEQAIATLGNDGVTTEYQRSKNGVAECGTCCDIWDTELTGRLRFKCSVCGGVSLEIMPRFCPNCGRKVVDE